MMNVPYSTAVSTNSTSSSTPATTSTNFLSFDCLAKEWMQCYLCLLL